MRTSSITISAALRTDSMTSPLALHTPTCPEDSPLSRAQGASPDTGLERGSLARELGEKQAGNRLGNRLGAGHASLQGRGVVWGVGVMEDAGFQRERQ